MDKLSIEIIDGVYQCNIQITTGQWVEILLDNEIKENYLDALMKFYDEPNHKSTCKSIGEKYNLSPQHFNSLIMNFGKSVQKKINNFEVVDKDGNSSYWIIPMIGTVIENNLFEWTLRPELVQAIKSVKLHMINHQFLTAFPVDSLINMSIESYTNLDRNNSFCYWIESKTNGIGSIWGGSSYKFGIYKWQNPPTSKIGSGKDDEYSWYSKYGSNRNEVFEKVRNIIAQIALEATEGRFKNIDEIDLGDAYKWKIAFLYSNKKLVSVFNKDNLEKAAIKLGFKKTNHVKVSELQDFLTHIAANRIGTFAVQ